MSFLPQFASKFTEQEKRTELYNLWSSIGVNTEKAILEELTRISSEFTDINNFNELTLRSWLAFFLMKIPYRTSATTQVTIKLSSEYSNTEIPQYSELTTDDGIIYTQMESVTLTPNDVRKITAVQGKRVTETGNAYSNLIKFQASKPDLNYLTVKVGNKVIPEVSYTSSYDQLKFYGTWKPQNEEGEDFGGTPTLENQFGERGQFYTVIADGSCKFFSEDIEHNFKIGDIVVHDGTSWIKMGENSILNPVQLSTTYAIPSNGYFAYYYDNYLFIKVFKGNDVDDPEGLPYEVSYIQSEGIQGKINANTLSYVSTFQDINENNVELDITNTQSTVAVNEPSVGKLSLYLRQRLYGNVSISSIPEYTTWFKAQPEVGDCLVLSDWEKFKRNGRTSLNVTGLVSVYLVDPDGNDISDINTQIELLDRLELYKDVGAVEIKSFAEVKQHLEFFYTSSSSDTEFESLIKSIASKYYNIPYLQSKNLSLFEDLDLSAIIQEIQTSSPYESTGLFVKGYHYYEKKYITSKATVSLSSYNGDTVGKGWYILETVKDDTVVTYKFIEDATSTGSCFIYDEHNPSVSIGTNVNGTIVINLTNYTFDDYATLKCYWGTDNEGILTIGRDDGVRRIDGDIKVTKVR